MVNGQHLLHILVYDRWVLKRFIFSVTAWTSLIENSFFEGKGEERVKF